MEIHETILPFIAVGYILTILLFAKKSNDHTEYEQRLDLLREHPDA